MDHKADTRRETPGLLGSGVASLALAGPAFLPKLKAAGPDAATLAMIMNDNPRRFLAYVPKMKRRG